MHSMLNFMVFTDSQNPFSTHINNFVFLICFIPHLSYLLSLYFFFFNLKGDYRKFKKKWSGLLDKVFLNDSTQI